MKYVAGHGIEVIVNCAAYTAVDKAEDNEDTCRKINALAVANLAKAAAMNRAKVIHISTDYDIAESIINRIRRVTKQRHARYMELRSLKASGYCLIIVPMPLYCGPLGYIRLTAIIL